MLALTVKGTCLLLTFFDQTLQSRNTVILDHHYYSQHTLISFVMS
jgi:hypothetical protein